jgi:hypothetical protein
VRLGPLRIPSLHRVPSGPPVALSAVPRTPLGLPSTASVALAPPTVSPFPSPSSSALDSSGLDVRGLERAYSATMMTLDQDVVAELVAAGKGLVDELEAAAPTLVHPDALRAFLVLWLSPVNLKYSMTAATVARLCSSVLALPQQSRDRLVKWIGADVPGVLFASRLVRPLQVHLAAHLNASITGRADAVVHAYPRPASTAGGSPWNVGGPRPISHHVAMELIARVLRLLYNLNEKLAGEAQGALDNGEGAREGTVEGGAGSGSGSGHEGGGGGGATAAAAFDFSTAPLGALVPPDVFYSEEVSSLPDSVFQNDYMRWRVAGYTRRVGAAEWSFCGYPFLFTAAAKRRVLSIEAGMSMQAEAQSAVARSIFGGIFGGGEAPYLVLRVRRSNLLADALNGLASVPVAALKKKLRVVFEGEEGIDESGLAKELFQLLIRQVFDPNFGLWVYDAETRTHFFNPACPPDVGREFVLIGILLGLAIYNGVLLDCAFPLAVYKKLLGLPVGLYDLRGVSPSLASGLEKLLEYPGEDAEEVFLLDHTATYEAFGEAVSVDLLPGGKDMPVTSSNKGAYVRLYTDWALNRSVEGPFAEFKRGFGMAMAGNALQLFRAEELELLVTGTRLLDFHALEAVTQYEGGTFSPAHPTVKAFWRVVHSLPDALKTKLLLFATGSAKAPIGGLGKLPFRVQRMGPDTDKLPTASTCFNTLLLPEYAGEEKLRDRLVLAISECAGFGLK